MARQPKAVAAPNRPYMSIIDMFIGVFDSTMTTQRNALCAAFRHGLRRAWSNEFERRQFKND